MTAQPDPHPMRRRRLRRLARVACRAVARHRARRVRTASSTSSTPGRSPRPGAVAAPTSRTSTARSRRAEAADGRRRRGAPRPARASRWERELIGGPPAKAIADVADVRNADEIILGTRGFGRVRALLGSVAHELIHLAPCPVTVIPERMVERDAARAAA